MKTSITRRRFLGGTAATLGFWMGGCGSRAIPGTGRLNVGIIGCTGQGGSDRNDLLDTQLVNIVALCDVDEQARNHALRMAPKARLYSDYRKMLEQKDIDAVVVATPDHTHACATLAALRSGRHVYCEKPLAHSIEECRVMTQTAQQLKLVTQLGTQIHAGSNYRRVVEIIQSGAIGTVHEAHVFVDASWSQDRPAQLGVPAPAGFDWNLWLGPARQREYSPDYQPLIWRRWWSFGNGALGDFGCHYIDLPNWALKLPPPSRVRAHGPPVHSEWCPPWLELEYEFPARGELPAVKLFWYDGGRRPEIPKDLDPREWPSGVLFVGDGGQLMADYGNLRLLPEQQFKDFQPPTPTIPPSVGHHKEWVVACLNNQPLAPLCNFSYGGPLTESVLLGAVAYRCGRAIEWDSEKLTAVNAPETQHFIRSEYRKGWEL